MTEHGGVRGLVEVMDRLRSPGGCPWDAEQTHVSLAGYALEEAYELAEAIESGDRAALREELGDVLLQVVFHARLAQEDATDPFGLDEVADGVTRKLVGRHPHVFGADAPDPAPDDLGPDPVADDPGTGAARREPAAADDDAVARTDDLHRTWERLKAIEKQRDSVLDGIPLAQGALARAQKVVARARRAGLTAPGVDARRLEVDGPAAPTAPAVPPGPAGPTAPDELGRALLALVQAADAAGVDAEAALRGVVRDLEVGFRAQERARVP